MASTTIESNSSVASMSELRHGHSLPPVQSWTEYLYRLHTDQIDHAVSVDFLGQQWHVSIYFAVLYMVLLYFGLKWMKNREAYNLRLPLAAWSGSLCIFSLLGTIAVWPELIKLMSRDGFVATYCDNSYIHDKRVVYWYTVFTLSKVAELIDTAFIVLRKQRLIPLHWVHHVLTLIYSFYTYRDEVSTARWMVVMNFTIHTVMYGYYCLKALQVNIPRPVAFVITTGQIAQMIFGFYMYWHILFGGLADTSSCRCTLRVSAFGFLLYSLFFYYFARFFFNTYLTKPKGKIAKKKTYSNGTYSTHDDLNNNQIDLLAKKDN